MCSAIRSGSMLRNSSSRVPRRYIVESTKVAPIFSAFDGMIPCQPKNGRQPTHSSGRKVISIATQLVNQPTKAATRGMLRYCQKTRSPSRVFSNAPTSVSTEANRLAPRATRGPDQRRRARAGRALERRPRCAAAGTAGAGARMPADRARWRMTTLEVRKTYKLYVRRRVRPLGVGALRRGPRPPGPALRQRLPRLAQGRARRGRQGARGAGEVGGHDRLSARPDPLPDGGDARGTPAPSFATLARPRGGPRGGAPRGARRRSTASSTTPAGRTSTRRCCRASTRSPRPTSTSRSPSRRAWSAWSRRSAGAARTGEPRAAGDRLAATRRSCSSPSPIRFPALEWAEVLATSDLPGGVVNLISGRKAEIAAAPRAPHGRQRARPRRPSAGARPSARAGRRGQRQAGAELRDRRLRRRERQGLELIRATVEIKTTWHPVGW